MEWNISFYNQKVEAETLSFPKGILANFLHIAEMIEECGPALGLPYTKALGNGLFEIRAKDTGRDWSVILLYCQKPRSFLFG